MMVILRAIKYNLDDLPEASVIIVFYNEPFSTLIRSVHSVLNRTPPSLLKEIILVDDGSNLPHIKSTNPEIRSFLEIYIETLPKVRLVRNPQRTGKTIEINSFFFIGLYIWMFEFKIVNKEFSEFFFIIQFITLLLMSL